MEFFEVVGRRRSIRSFLDKPVEDEKLQRILLTANQAPSAGNLQAYEIYVVSQPVKKAELASAALDQSFVASAPIVLVFCSHPSRSEWRYRQRGVTLYTLQDATIACTFAMLAATALGLGSVWVGAFNEKAVQRCLETPNDILPVALLPLGYPAENPPVTSRRRLSEMVHMT